VQWYPWYPIDFRRDTLRLTFAEDGAYRRLIDEYMVLRGPLPDDDAVLARLLGVGLSEWMEVAPTVRQFFRAKDGTLHHKRCEREIAAQNRRNERFSNRGKKAAFARHSKINGVDARRMLVYATEHNNTDLTSKSEYVPRHQGAVDKSSLIPSPELQAIMRSKLR
jgi:uncharacterized protein YdaU (DUF1376 family)